MSSNEIGIFEAKTQLSKLIEQVQAGGAPILITKHGKPVAQLSAVGTGSAPRVRGCGAGGNYFMAPDFDEPLEDFADYMRTESELADQPRLRAAEQPPGER